MSIDVHMNFINMQLHVNHIILLIVNHSSVITVQELVIYTLLQNCVYNK